MLRAQNTKEHNKRTGLYEAKYPSRGKKQKEDDSCTIWTKNNKGLDIAQVVIRLYLTQEPRVRFQFDPCGICGE